MDTYQTIFMLRCFGMWHCDDWLTGWKAKLYTVYTVFIFSVVYSFTLSHLLMLHVFINDAHEFADASFVLLTCIATCGKMFNMIWKREIIGVSFRTLQEDLHRPRDSEELAIDIESVHRTRLYTCLTGILAELSCTMLTVLSFIRDFPRRELPHKSLLPFSTSTPMAYSIAFLHQIIARYIVASINIGFDTLVPGMMVIICTQLSIFKHRVRKIHKIVEKARNSCKDTFHLEDQVRMERQLVAGCVKHHCAIVQLAKVTNDTFATSMILQYYASAMILCVCTYSLSRVIEVSVEFFCLTMYLSMMLLQIYILCRYATEVKLESESINDGIHSSDWTSLSARTQKSLVIIMTRVQRPVEYRVGHIMFSLDSFTSLIKLSYSACNVLQQQS